MTPAERLAAALEVWATRDDSRAQPEVRAAANDAIDAIDDALKELHQVRARLAQEMYESDRATDRRIDALLARNREAAR